MAIGMSGLAAGLGYAANVGISENKEWSTGEFFKKIGLGAVAGALSFGVGLISGFTGFRIPFKGGGVGAKYRVLRFGIETVLSIPRYLLKLVG